ncbi:hypothetical protein FA95DRAFT_1605521 [Auriscalpium vulgare]|uniref:Uncharacterized protein n=1 Tax=Auriscalpium vulgare TaxID=40419 RepID=A0ACB8RW93_9AGAM|nr:hypothetical protein FA95DRAFT_1605521 [Auriscalpium vulgare]
MPPPPVSFDIHFEILQCVYIFSQSHVVAYRTLYSCALVCREWVKLAQRLLFRHIGNRVHRGINSEDIRTASLLQEFTASTRLCSYVRSIPTDVLASGMIISTGHVLSPASRNSWSCVMSIHTRRPMSCVRSVLHPSMLVYYFDPDPNYLPAVIEALPSLRHLVLKTSGGLLQLKLPPNSQLVSLKYGTAINFAQLSMLPGPAADSEISFQDMHLGYLHFWVKMTGIERCIARNLRSLTLWMLVPSNATLEQLTALQSLIIGGTPKTTLTLPRTLRHFGLHQRLCDLGMRVDQTSLQDAGTAPSADPVT